MVKIPARNAMIFGQKNPWKGNSLSYVLRTNRKARFRDEGIETNRAAPRLFHFRLAADKYVATVSPRRAPQMRRSCVKIEKLQSWSGRDTANGSRFVACWNGLGCIANTYFQSVSSRMGLPRTRGLRRVLFSNFHNGRRYRSFAEEEEEEEEGKKRNGKCGYVSRYREAMNINKIDKVCCV